MPRMKQKPIPLQSKRRALPVKQSRFRWDAANKKVVDVPIDEDGEWENAKPEDIQEREEADEPEHNGDDTDEDVTHFVLNTGSFKTTQDGFEFIVSVKKL